MAAYLDGALFAGAHIGIAWSTVFIDLDNSTSPSDWVLKAILMDGTATARSSYTNGTLRFCTATPNNWAWWMSSQADPAGIRLKAAFRSGYIGSYAAHAYPYAIRTSAGVG